MEPDLTMVGNLPLPKRLLKLIETGRWPRTHEEELHQNIRPLVSKERVQAFAPEWDLYFLRPPFSTVASLIANGHTFESPFCALEQITPDLSILIGGSVIRSMRKYTCPLQTGNTTQSPTMMACSQFGPLRWASTLSQLKGGEKGNWMSEAGTGAK